MGPTIKPSTSLILRDHLATNVTKIIRFLILLIKNSELSERVIILI